MFAEMLRDCSSNVLVFARSLWEFPGPISEPRYNVTTLWLCDSYDVERKYRHLFIQESTIKIIINTQLVFFFSVLF